MKKTLKIILLLIFVVFVGGICFAAYINIKGIPTYTPVVVDLKIKYTPERVKEGQRLASMLCEKCHMNEEGTSVSGKLMADCPTSFGIAYSANITQDKMHGIGSWTDGELDSYIRTGVKPNGNYVPPYMPKFAQMSSEDMACIISWLRSNDPKLQPKAIESVACQPSWFLKFLSNVAFKPLPYPQKPIAQINPNDMVSYGKYCVQTRYQCYACHSADFATNNELKPEESKGYCGGGNKMPDYSQTIIPTANITFHKETGIGQWTFEEFDRALRAGIVPGGNHALRYPMDPYINLTPEEVKAIYEYLKTIPKITNKVDRGV